MDASPDERISRSPHRRWRARRCAICARRLRRAGLLLAEEPDVSVPQTWTVCANCHEAVLREVEHSALRNPLRLRIAVGVVAARHESPAHYSILDDRFWEQLSDEGVNRLLIWVFAIAFGVHAVAFALIAAYIAIAH